MVPNNVFGVSSIHTWLKRKCEKHTQSPHNLYTVHACKLNLIRYLHKYIYGKELKEIIYVAIYYENGD